jgi:hypothetical protein
MACHSMTLQPSWRTSDRQQDNCVLQWHTSDIYTLSRLTNRTQCCLSPSCRTNPYSLTPHNRNMRPHFPSLTPHQDHAPTPGTCAHTVREPHYTYVTCGQLQPQLHTSTKLCSKPCMRCNLSQLCATSRLPCLTPRNLNRCCWCCW